MVKYLYLLLIYIFFSMYGSAHAQIRMNEGGQTAELQFDGSESRLDFWIGGALSSRLKDLGILSLLGLGPASTASLQPGFDTVCSGAVDEGTIRYNSALTRVEICNGTDWINAF